MGFLDYIKKAAETASQLKDALPEVEKFVKGAKEFSESISDSLSGTSKELFDAITNFTFAVIDAILLRWREVVTKFEGWMTNHSEIPDEDQVAFVIQEKLSNGKVKVIKGLFNNGAAKTLVEGDLTNAEELDQEMIDIIGDEEFVVLQ